MGTYVEQLIPDEEVSPSKGRIRLNSIVDTSFQNGYMRKKEQLLTLLLETILEKKLV